MLHFIITVTEFWLPLTLEGVYPLLSVFVLKVLRHDKPALPVRCLEGQLHLVMVELLPQSYHAPGLAGNSGAGLLKFSLYLLG